MGQAKRRGSYEERVTQAIEKNHSDMALQHLAVEREKRRIHCVKLLRRAGFKTMFCYQESNGSDTFNAPWAYNDRPLSIAEAARQFEPRRSGSRAKGLSKIQMLALLGASAAFSSENVIEYGVHHV